MGNFQEIKKVIMESNDILITTHQNPDGDGIGGALALFLALNKLNHDRMKVVRIAIEDELPSFLKFLPSSQVIENIKYVHEKAKFDAIISIDVSNRERVGEPLKFKRENTKLINIDHHISNENYGDINYVDPKSSSTCEIIYELIKELNVEIDKDISECIYCGIINDTGNFSYNNVSSKTFEIAAELKKNNIENEKITENLFSNKSLARLKILGYALENMKFIEKKKLLYVTISKEILEKYNGKKEDTEGIVENLRSYSEAEIALLLREDKPGFFKGSLRSKGVDVNKIASIFGGGGHTKAAGFFTNLLPEEVVKIILEN